MTKFEKIIMAIINWSAFISAGGFFVGIIAWVWGAWWGQKLMATTIVSFMGGIALYLPFYWKEKDLEKKSHEE